MKRWLLVDYDCTGLLTIQARDEHPKRDAYGPNPFDDEDAIALVRCKAKRGNVDAIEALRQHDRDWPAIQARFSKGN